MRSFLPFNIFNVYVPFRPPPPRGDPSRSFAIASAYNAFEGPSDMILIISWRVRCNCSSESPNATSASSAAYLPLCRARLTFCTHCPGSRTYNLLLNGDDSGPKLLDKYVSPYALPSARLSALILPFPRTSRPETSSSASFDEVFDAAGQRGTNGRPVGSVLLPSSPCPRPLPL